jgi:hypothetical protein
MSKAVPLRLLAALFALALSPPLSPETINIGTWNIRNLGKAKLSQPRICEAIAAVINQYDLIAIQEYKGPDTALSLSLISRLPSRYAFITGKPAGRTSQKETPLVIYNPAKITLSPLVRYPDTADVFERPPAACLAAARNGNLKTVIITLHTKPSDATWEINNLQSVVAYFQNYFQEKDVILLGDMNADSPYFRPVTISQVFPPPRFLILTGNGTDTTTASASKTYDRIIITATAVEDYQPGTAAAMAFGTSGASGRALAPQDISDHKPLAAAFHTDRDTD